MLRKYLICAFCLTLLVLTFSLPPSKNVLARPLAQESPPTAAEVIEAVNALRIANGLLPLNTHPVLMQVAEWEASAIAGVPINFKGSFFTALGFTLIEKPAAGLRFF